MSNSFMTPILSLLWRWWRFSLWQKYSLSKRMWATAYWKKNIAFANWLHHLILSIHRFVYLLFYISNCQLCSGQYSTWLASWTWYSAQYWFTLCTWDSYNFCNDWCWFWFWCWEQYYNGARNEDSINNMDNCCPTSWDVSCCNQCCWFLGFDYQFASHMLNTHKLIICLRTLTCLWALLTFITIVKIRCSYTAKSPYQGKQ